MENDVPKDTDEAPQALTLQQHKATRSQMIVEATDGVEDIYTMYKALFSELRVSRHGIKMGACVRFWLMDINQYHRIFHFWVILFITISWVAYNNYNRGINLIEIEIIPEFFGFCLLTAIVYLVFTLPYWAILVIITYIVPYVFLNKRKFIPEYNIMNIRHKRKLLYDTIYIDYKSSEGMPLTHKLVFVPTVEKPGRATNEFLEGCKEKGWPVDL